MDTCLHKKLKQHIRLSYWMAILSVALLLAGCSSRQPDDQVVELNINEHKGKWVLINYWAEWCVPCITEIPELNALAASHAADFELFAVNFDRLQGEELRQLADKMGIAFTALNHDPAEQLKLARPAALPTTYLFNREGELSFKLVGPQTAEEIIERVRSADKSVPN